MKILFISQYFYPEQFSNNSIATELVERGHEVNAVSAVPNYPAGVFFENYSNRARRHEHWNGINIYRAWTVPRGSSSYKLILNYLVYPITAIQVIVRTKISRSDVSFTSMPSPLTQSIASIATKKFYKVPTVYWVQDIWPDSALYMLGIKNRVFTKILEAFCGWMYRQADILLIQSDAFRSQMERFGVNPGRIRLLPNTAPHIYRPLVKTDVNRRVSDLIDRRCFNVMFAGNIGEAQDVDTIIAAAALLKHEADIKFVIVGSGRYQERAESKVREANLEKCINFVGRHEESLMPDFFALADVMLVTLKDNPVFRLTVPYKIQCYMACGKFIISGVNGEGARIVEAAECGFAVPAESPQHLASAIMKAKNMPTDERKRLEENSRRYYDKNYSNEIVYGIIQKAITDAADKSQAR